MRHWLRRVTSAVVLAGAIAGLAAVGLSAGVFAGFQRRAADTLFPSAARDSEVVIVGIDQRSLAALGLLPWPRSVHARLARQFAAAGVDTAVWDVIFAGPREGDAEFATALAGVRAVVLAEKIVTRPSPRDDALLEVTSRQGPEASLLSGPAVRVAHAQVAPDPTDGVTRTLPIVVEERDGTLVPALALEAFRASRGDVGPLVVARDGIHSAERFVPTEGRHALRLNWADGLDRADGPSVLSALDVYTGRIDPEVLRDKIVLVGATESTLGDNQLVPLAKSGGIPGVLIHANALNTMLTASYLHPVPDPQTVVWVFVLALLVALGVLLLPLSERISWLIGMAVLVGGSILVTGMLAAAYLVVAFIRFDQGDIMNLVYPFPALALAFTGALVIRYATEMSRRRRVSALFARYVPPAVARQLEESGGLDAHLAGERLDVSLFFCDLRGFTSLSATLEPPQVRAMLDEFYGLTTDVILAAGGTVLKFIGDEVLAVFGAPLPVDHHPQVALECAMEIHRRTPDLGARLVDLGIPATQFGIGMSSGEVVAAHVGGGHRRQYDVVGDTVNLAEFFPLESRHIPAREAVHSTATPRG